MVSSQIQVPRPYASLRDARLRTALEAHDVLVKLVSSYTAKEDGRLMDELVRLFAQLDEIVSGLEDEHGKAQLS